MNEIRFNKVRGLYWILLNFFFLCCSILFAFWLLHSENSVYIFGSVRLEITISNITRQFSIEFHVFFRLLNVTIHCHHNYIQFGFSLLHGFTRDEWKIVLNVHKFHGVRYNEFNNYFIFVFCSSSCDTFNCILIRAMTLSKKKMKTKLKIIPNYHLGVNSWKQNA